MNAKSLKVVDAVQEGATQFGDVLSALAAGKGWNKRALAREVGCSPSTLSLVGSGERGLSAGVAIALAEKLGGTQEIWENVFKETKGGSALSIGSYKSKILESGPIDQFEGSRVRRLRRQHIENLLLQPEVNGSGEGRNVFRIDPYSPSLVRETSYDTTIGSVQKSESDPSIDIEGFYEVPAGTSVLITTKEAITLPMWMEAEVHPATSVAKKHLVVSGGPIVDPGFDNFLCAAVFNPTNERVRISTGEAFLTLRFWIQEV